MSMLKEVILSTMKLTSATYRHIIAKADSIEFYETSGGKQGN